jgi:hypothetical protein
MDPGPSRPGSLEPDRRPRSRPRGSRRRPNGVTKSPERGLDPTVSARSRRVLASHARRSPLRVAHLPIRREVTDVMQGTAPPEHRRRTLPLPEQDG